MPTEHFLRQDPPESIPSMHIARIGNVVHAIDAPTVRGIEKFQAIMEATTTPNARNLGVYIGQDLSVSGFRQSAYNPYESGNGEMSEPGGSALRSSYLTMVSRRPGNAAEERTYEIPPACMPPYEPRTKADHPLELIALTPLFKIPVDARGEPTIQLDADMQELRRRLGDEASIVEELSTGLKYLRNSRNGEKDMIGVHADHVARFYPKVEQVHANPEDEAAAQEYAIAAQTQEAGRISARFLARFLNPNDLEGIQRTRTAELREIYLRMTPAERADALNRLRHRK